MIYEWITSRCVLTIDHQYELKTKRGFTEATIKKYRFFSGGKHNLALESDLEKQFSKDELIEAGVFLKKKDIIHIDPVFLDDRIIIPYLNKDGVATLVRPHKLGLKNIPVQIYHPFNLTQDAEIAIITEGEFKAAAACQLGFACIAVPGIASYAGQKYPDLIKLLTEYGIKEVCICFDNELKNDPKFQNYKPDAMDRWDTQYYAFIMAKQLNKDGLNTRIAILPDSWRQSGKIDIDGALASGKTEKDLLYVFRRAQTPKEFHDDLEEEAREIIRKKEAKRYFKSHVYKDWGKYVAKRCNGKREWEETISNFTFRIVATHETQEGIVREVQFINEFGKSAPFFTVGPDEMSGNDGFATFCFRHGNFVWSGRKEDLYKIWEQEFINDTGRHIIEPDSIGWQVAQKMWLFGNVAFEIKKDGKNEELRPDEQGIFWNEKHGFKPVPLGVSSGKNLISEGIPYLNTNKCDLEAIKGKLIESIGDFEAKTCLGWACGVLFMEEVFALYNCFPFLFITGRRRSGKSTIAEWIMNLYGFENSGKQAADTTSIAMQRYMSYYSSLPTFIDEYRNDLKVTSKNGLFRNAYNRQSAGKGVKSDFGIREAKIRGTLIIAGEETPEDNALLTRCITVQVSEIRRHVNHFDWFTKNRAKLSSFTYEILANYNKYIEKFLIRLIEDKREIAEHSQDDRLAINKAVISAGVFTLFGEDAQYAKNFVEDLRIVKAEQESENAVSMFFADVQALSVDKSIHLKDYVRISEGKIFLYFHGIYNIWAKDYQTRKKEAPFKAEAIRSYLKDEPGFVDTNYLTRIQGNRFKCVVFNFDLAPDFIQNLGTEDSGATSSEVTTSVPDKPLFSK